MLASLQLALHSAVAPPERAGLRQSRPAGRTVQQVLREALRWKSDIPLVPVAKSPSGGQVALSMPDMVGAYNRRRDHMLGHRAILEWALGEAAALAACPHAQLTTPQVAIAFWYNLDKGVCTLPDSVRAGLASAIHHGKLEVHLYTYQDLQDVPSGVKVEDAAAVMSASEFEAAKYRLPVQWLADLIRLRALMAHEGGWFIDGDCVFLRRAPSLSILEPPAVGHYFACMDAAPHRQGNTSNEHMRYWLLEYLQTPGDQAHLASPCAFPGHSPVLAAIVSSMNSVLQAGAKVKYDDVFTRLTKLVRTWGLEAAISPPAECSPVPRLHGDKCLDPSRNHLFDVESIKKALCVNNFWQSSKALPHSGTPHTNGSLQRVIPGSIWGMVVELATMRSKSRLRSKTPAARCPTQPARAQEAAAAAAEFSVGQPSECTQEAAALAAEVSVGQPSARAQEALAAEVAVGQPSAAQHACLDSSREWEVEGGGLAGPCPPNVAAACPPTKRVKVSVWPPCPDHVRQTRFPSMISLEELQQVYELGDELGAGAYGKVFLASRVTDKQQVAVKVSRDSASASMEPVFLHHCQHPHIVQLIDAWASPAYTVLVMPVFECSLSRFIKSQSSTLPIVCSQSVSLQIAEGLAHMHSLQIMHRDLHLGNVLISTQPGDKWRVVVSDLGRATLVQGHDGRADVFNCAYRPPEIFFSRGSSLVVDRSGRLQYVAPQKAAYGTPADVWALACMMVVVVTGRLPWGEVGENVLAHIRGLLLQWGIPDLLMARRNQWTFFDVDFMRLFRGHSEPTGPGSLPIPPGIMKTCIEAALIYDPRRRATAVQVVSKVALNLR